MSTEVSWVFEAAVKPDSLNDFRALAREISADNKSAEPGQLSFEWFIDGNDVHIYERYRTQPRACSTYSGSSTTSPLAFSVCALLPE
jgi:quinol monooxygenase YgiN